MSAPVQHATVPKEHMHDPYRWIVADDAARLALSVLSIDVGKWLRQTGDNTTWELINDSPVEWANRGVPGGYGTAALEDVSETAAASKVPISDANGLIDDAWLKNRTFNTVAEMIADTDIKLGQTIGVYDYANGNNSGILFFKAVAAATGTADGGSYIDSVGVPTVQFKQNFPALITVKMFGATGNGVTDDGAAIQAAFNTGWVIDLAESSYAFTSKLTFTNSFKNGSLKFTGSAINDNLVECVSAQDIAINYVKIDGNSVNNGTKALLNIRDSTNVIVTRSIFDNIYSIGVSVVGGSGNRVTKNNFTKVSPAGTYINQAINVSDATTVPQNIEIYGNFCTGTAIAVLGKNCDVTKNWVTEWQYGGGITFVPGANETDYGGHLVKGNHAFDSIGIDINSTPPAGIECSQPRCLITNNFCYENAGEGIVSASTYGQVIDNTCYNNGQEITALAGSKDGIHIRSITGAAGTDQLVSINKCYDTQSTKTQLYGIRVNSGMARIMVTGNDPRGNSLGEYVMPTSAVFELTDSHGVYSNISGNLVISSGAVTITGGHHQIDTEAAAASDDLDTINGGIEGRRVVIGMVSAARVVTVKDNVGNLKLAGDFVMGGQYASMELMYRDGFWLELSRSNN